MGTNKYNLSKDEDHSDIPELQVPDFDCNIPPHLMTGLSEEMQYIMNQMNLINQKQDYLIAVARDSNLQQRRTNGQVRKLKSWQTDASENLDYLNEDFEDNRKVKEAVSMVTKGWKGIVFFFSVIAFLISSVFGALRIFDFFRN